MKAAAFFDLDGTILRGNIVRYYAHLRMQDLRQPWKALWATQFLCKIPLYIVMDRFSRRWFTKTFYRNYRAIDPIELKRRREILYREFLRPRLFPAAVEKIRWHQRSRHEIVLVTGSIKEIVAPLATHLGVNEVLACRLEERNDAFTGELETGPMTDLQKVRAVRRHCRRRGISLDRCYAYADSLDDIPMLEQVGHPFVINPGWKLRHLAERKGWRVLRWDGRASLETR